MEAFLFLGGIKVALLRNLVENVCWTGGLLSVSASQWFGKFSTHSGLEKTLVGPLLKYSFNGVFQRIFGSPHTVCIELVTVGSWASIEGDRQAVV